MDDPKSIFESLEGEREDLAELEHAYLRAKVEGYFAAGAKTVKENEMYGELAALDIHRELVRQRAIVRSWEDLLKVTLHALS